MHPTQTSNPELTCQIPILGSKQSQRHLLPALISSRSCNSRPIHILIPRFAANQNAPSENKMPQECPPSTSTPPEAPCLAPWARPAGCVFQLLCCFANGPIRARHPHDKTGENRQGKSWNGTDPYLSYFVCHRQFFSSSLTLLVLHSVCASMGAQTFELKPPSPTPHIPNMTGIFGFSLK